MMVALEYKTASSIYSTHHLTNNGNEAGTFAIHFSGRCSNTARFGSGVRDACLE